MASNSVEVDSDATISDLSSSGVPVDEIPPPVLDAQEEEVAMEQRNKEVDVPKWLKDLKRTVGTYIHKDYRHQFRSKGEVELFVESEGIENGIFKGRKLQKKKIAGMDAQDAGTSKSAGRRASANHARPKCSLGLSRPMDDEEMAPGFP
ncbi:unnamed protein product [Miscanthus lutarioriparius]|uniref:Uncharacterized protein n=1 Tax=Miscanthus lutarioriparius TaxID=422564 RepID=A0A811R7X6_9POAL|nr:unnamed protein product [Miscanthus lutarioriparius]